MSSFCKENKFYNNESLSNYAASEKKIEKSF